MVAVISEPERSRASTTTVIAPSAAMIRLRAGKVHRRGRVPGGSSPITGPLSTISLVEPRTARRVGDVHPVAENSDGQAAGLQAPRMRARVDAHRHAADHRQPGRGDLAAQLRRRARGRSCSGAGSPTIVTAPSGTSSESSAGSPRPKSRPGASPRSRERLRIARVVPTAGPRSRARSGRAQSLRVALGGPARNSSARERAMARARSSSERASSSWARLPGRVASPPSRCGRRARRPARRAAGSRSQARGRAPALISRLAGACRAPR